MFYAAVALSFAVHAFEREDVLIGGDERAEVRAARLPWWNADGARIPSPPTAILFTGLVGVLFFYAGSIFATAGEAGILASQWLLITAPVVLFLRVGRFSWRDTLGVRPAPRRAFLAAALVMLGGIPIGWTIAWVQTFFLELPEELTASLQGILTANGPARTAWLLLVVALTPAICEELLFRGVLLRGFLRGHSAGFAIFVSSAVFGVFHLSFETVIRLLPAMFLGSLVGLVAWRTRSIFPSMMMHFLNNAMAVLLVSTPALQRLITVESGGPSPVILMVGLVLLLLGVRELRALPTPLPTPDIEGR
jgi:sodium transport system permease protein